MIRVLLDGVEISGNVEVDGSFVEKLDRELDEGFIVISHTDRKDQFPMFSAIDILENNTLLFSGRISGDIVELSAFSENVYNHNVSLIEHTKLLEKYLINGKTFTQPIGDIGVPFYTLFDVVESLRLTALFEKSGQQDIFAPFTIPQETKEEIENIIAPEFSFKDVTLRQALDEVANVIDSITRLTRENEIIFDKFNDLNDQIDAISENYKKQQNIDNFSTILSSDVSNPVSSQKDTLRESEYYPAKHLWTTLRSDFGQFDFEASYIPTPKPIYEVLELKTVIGLKFGEGTTIATYTPEIDEDFLELDLSRNVVEKNKYDTLPTLIGTRAIVDGVNIAPSQEAQGGRDITNGFFNVLDRRTVMIYDYGKKNIQVGKTYGVFNVLTAYPNIIQNATLRYLQEFTGDSSLEFFVSLNTGFRLRSANTGKNYFVLINLLGSLDTTISFERWKELFRLKYIPVPPSIRYEVVRDDVSEVDFYTNQTINQKLRIVDLEAFTNNMKGRINQLSESQLTLSHKVKNIQDSWYIGDFTADKFVITKKEVIFQLDHYVINYELNKNFNKISQFMGIDQEIRQWEIGESGRSLDRDLNYNEYIEVFADDSGTFNIQNNDTTLLKPELFLSTFNATATPKPLSFATFSSRDLIFEDGTPINLNLPFYKMAGGDSFGIYFDFETNASAGNDLREGEKGFTFNLLDEALRRLKIMQGSARYFNTPIKYTNEIGRLDTFSFSLYNEDLTRPISNFDLEANESNLLPVFTREITEEPVTSSTFFAQKDSRERLKFTLQYHLISKDISEVIVGNKTTSNNFLFIENANNLELRTFKNKRFTKRDKDKVLNGFEDKFTSNFLTINNTNSFIEVTKDLTGIDAWAITDSDGKPFIMVNGNKKRVVFEFKNKRDNIRYLRTGFEEVYKPPVLESSSSTDTAVTLTLRNPNDEEVIIESFLSVRIQDGIQMSNVLANETVTFTFTGLEQNTIYTFSNVCNNLNPSIGFSGNGKKNSPRRTYNVRTQVMPLDLPVYEQVRIITEDEATAGAENRFVVFNITNTNDIPLVLKMDIDGSETDVGFVIEDSTNPLDESINTVRFVEGEFAGEVIVKTWVEPGETVEMSPLRQFRAGSLDFEFISNFSFNWETFTLRQNFVGDSTPEDQISIKPFEQPVYIVDGLNAPVRTSNSIQVRWNNPNTTSAVLEVEIYSFPSGLRIETKTVTVPANSNGDVLFQDLAQNREFEFRARFLEGSGRLASRQVGDRLFTAAADAIIETTLSDLGAAPIITRVAATTTSLTLRFTNVDPRDAFIQGGFAGIVEAIGLEKVQGNGDFVDKTFTGLRAGEKYTFEAEISLEGQDRSDQKTIFETFTTPARPTVELIGNPAATGFAARARNTGNAYPVEIRRDGILLTPSPTDPGSFSDVVVSGLAPNSSNTFAFVSRLDGLDSATTSINIQTLGPLSNPVVTTEARSTTQTSITPRITNNNNRQVRAFGRWLPFNLNDLGLVSSGGSAIGANFSDEFLSANSPVTFYSQFKDPASPDLETNIVQTTLYTAPLNATNLLIEGFGTSGGVENIDISFFNPNPTSLTFPINALIEIGPADLSGVDGSITLTNIAKNSTVFASVEAQFSNKPLALFVTLLNPTSETTNTLEFANPF